MSQIEVSPEYWSGVRDAFRMVETFLFWKEKNPDEPRSLNQFISEALDAVRKRCGPCLQEILGLTFGKLGIPAPQLELGLTAPEPTREPTVFPEGPPTPEPTREPEPVTHPAPEVFLAPIQEEPLPTPEPEHSPIPEAPSPPEPTLDSIPEPEPFPGPVSAPEPELPPMPELPPVPEYSPAPEPELPPTPELPPMPEVPPTAELPPMPEVPPAPELPPIPEAPPASSPESTQPETSEGSPAEEEDKPKRRTFFF